MTIDLNKYGRKIKGKNFFSKIKILKKEKVLKGGGVENDILSRGELISQLYNSILMKNGNIPQININEKIGNKTVLMEMIENWNVLSKYITEDGLINLIKEILKIYEPDLNITNEYSENVLILSLKYNLGYLAKIFDNYQKTWFCFDYNEKIINFAIENDCVNFIKCINRTNDNMIFNINSSGMFFILMNKDVDITLKDNDQRDILSVILKNFEFNKKMTEKSIKYASYRLLKYGFEDYVKYCDKKIKHKKSKELLNIIEYLYYNSYNFSNIDKHGECFLHHSKNIHPYIKALLITLYSGKESISYEGYTWFIKIIMDGEWDLYKPLIAQYDFKYPITLNHQLDNYFIVDFIINNKFGGKKIERDLKDALLALCFKYAKYGKNDVRKFINKQTDENIERLIKMNDDMDLIENFKKDKILMCYNICLNKLLQSLYKE